MPPQPDDSRLRGRCDEVLHYIWDPIGIAGTPEARDEYDSYLGGALSLLRGGAAVSQIVDYLVEIETATMGLTPNRAQAQTAADALVDWREFFLQAP